MITDRCTVADLHPSYRHADRADAAAGRLHTTIDTSVSCAPAGRMVQLLSCAAGWLTLLPAGRSRTARIADHVALAERVVTRWRSAASVRPELARRLVYGPGASDRSPGSVDASDLARTTGATFEQAADVLDVACWATDADDLPRLTAEYAARPVPVTLAHRLLAAHDRTLRRPVPDRRPELLLADPADPQLWVGPGRLVPLLCDPLDERRTVWRGPAPRLPDTLAGLHYTAGFCGSVRALPLTEAEAVALDARPVASLAATLLASGPSRPPGEAIADAKRLLAANGAAA